MKYQIFISYRRSGGEVLGQLLLSRLKSDGFRVFFDVETMRSGKFNEQIYDRLDECSDVVVILPAGGLERCVNEDDWLRKEVSYAIKQKKNIVPVMMRNFAWPAVLPPEMQDLMYYNGVNADMEFFDAWYQKMVSLLSCCEKQSQPTQVRNLYEVIQQQFLHGCEKKEANSWIQNKLKARQSAEMEAEALPICKRIVPAYCLPEGDMGETDEMEHLFTLLDSPGMISLVFEVVDRLNFESKSLISYLQRVEGYPEKSEAGADVLLYYVKKRPVERHFLLITVSNEPRNERALMNTAVLTEEGSLFVSKKPENVGIMRLSSKGEIINETDQGDVLDDFLSIGLLHTAHQETQQVQAQLVTECAFDMTYLRYLVIDIEKREPVVPELYRSSDGKAMMRLRMWSHHPYLCIEVTPSFYRNNFSYYEGESYLCGIRGVKRNVFRAANAFHQAIEKDPKDCDSSFQLGCMFRYLEELKSPEDALHYLTLSAKQGHPGARYELATLQLEMADNQQTVRCAVQLLKGLLDDGCESYGQTALADILKQAYEQYADGQ